MSRNAVLIIADALQFPPAVFLASRLAALRGSRAVDIFVATDSVADIAKAKVFGGPFELIDVSGLYPDLALPTTNYFTRATYYSLFVPKLLQDRYDRLLYVDVDTYPESEKVFALLDLDLGGNAVAAVRDLLVAFIPGPKNLAELAATLRLPPGELMGAKYLNSGVLLIDLKAYQRDRMDKQALKVLRDGRIELRLPDQTVFNALLKRRWLELSPSFNMITRAWSSFINGFVPPIVVHFTGPVKPWHRAFIDDHPVRGELAGFLKDTPWSTFLADVNPPPRLISVDNLPPPPERQGPIWRDQALAAVIRYLRETPFADVDQGITVANPAALPALD
jgi:lipopolysaccharide biosynthesis glycosyltransferase